MAEIKSIYDQDKNAPGYRREVERLYEKARITEAAALRNAKNEGKNEEKKEIARNALQMNLTVESIVKLTGLNPEEINNL